jgi:hypothetical protein
LLCQFIFSSIILFPLFALTQKVEQKSRTVQLLRMRVPARAAGNSYYDFYPSLLLK